MNLVQRLRSWKRPGDDIITGDVRLYLDAADEIERLQSAKREALKIADERSKENAALRAGQPRSTEAEKQVGHKVIAWLFDLPVRDMGGGLRIVTPQPSYLSVDERDVIVKAVREFMR